MIQAGNCDGSQFPATIGSVGSGALNGFKL